MLRTEALKRVTEKTSMGNGIASWKFEFWYDTHDICCALFLSLTDSSTIQVPLNIIRPVVDTRSILTGGGFCYSHKQLVLIIQIQTAQS